jgi:hypothetical protein
LLYVLGIPLVLNQTQKVVCITHQLANAVHLRLDLLLKPQIQYIVQEYVGDDGAEITPLGCPLLG